MNKAQIERQRATQRLGQVIGYAGGNVSNETDVLLIAVSCELCEHCTAVAYKAEKKTYSS
jgi:hypothetical protein